MTAAAAGQEIITSRESHPNMSLAELYDPARTPADLLAAHDALDQVIDSIFGIDEPLDEGARQQLLFKRYASMTSNGTRR